MPATNTQDQAPRQTKLHNCAQFELESESDCVSSRLQPPAATMFLERRDQKQDQDQEQHLEPATYCKRRRRRRPHLLTGPSAPAHDPFRRASSTFLSSSRLIGFALIGREPGYQLRYLKVFSVDSNESNASIAEEASRV